MDIRDAARGFIFSMLGLGPAPFVLYYVIGGGNPWWLATFLPVAAAVPFAIFPRSATSQKGDSQQRRR
jgi:hypothetical protein